MNWWALQKDHVFEKAEELLDIPADTLAQMVKQPDDPKAINLAHSAFNHPREYWDKILTSPVFSDVEEVELVKLLMVHPYKQLSPLSQDDAQQKPIIDFESSLDSRLVVSLPKMVFMGDPKSRKCQGHAEFILLTRLEEDVMRTHEIGEKNKSKLVGEQETVISYYLQIVRFHRKTLQPYVKR